MRVQLVPCILAAAWIGFPQSSDAHHSYSEFDDTKTVEIEGTLLDAAWVNPHARVEVQVRDADGRVAVWDIESAGRNNFNRMNVPLEMFAVGGKIKVAGWPSKRSNVRMYATNMLSADGRELVLWRYSMPRWASVVYGYGSDRSLFADGAATGAATIFQVWASDLDDPDASPPALGRVQVPLTAAAEKALAAFDPVTDTTNVGCTPKGMPVVMGQPFPIEFVDQGDTILLRMEEYDTRRMIHMSTNAPAETPVSTLLGYSTGRWDGKTLVVATSHISERYANGRGVPLGAGATTLERFTPSEDGSRLNYTLTVTAREAFTAAVEQKRSWVSRPGERVLPFNCDERSVRPSKAE